MKVVGISGAQGAGKSHMLMELKARGFIVDDFKVSRSVQAALGWSSLDRVMDAPLTMMQFQREVFTQKFKHDIELKKSPDDSVVLTERTFADILAYTSHWCWKFVDENRLNIRDALEFLVQYTLDCREAQRAVYNGTVLLPLMDHVLWENDPNRASKEDAALIFENIEKFMERQLDVSYPRMTISAKTIEDRATQVEQFIQQRI